MKAALVIMAAGMGSRYGGEKQVDGIGPAGEILMEYSVHDALRAGFTKVVFIIKPEMRPQMEALCGYLSRCKTAEGAPLEVCYAYQDFSAVPSFYTVPADRVKPFGTVHALLCAKNCVQEPFVVINADDYYGVDAFRTIFSALSALAPRGEGCMVGYRLANTVSEHGTVTRGVCHVTEKGYLDRVVETFRLAPCADGLIRDLREEGESPVFAPETPVSMNFWGFTPWLFEKLEDYFNAFLRALPEGECKAECLLPALIGRLIDQGELSVRVLHSDARWFGMTYHEDRELVRAALLALHEAGIYPPTLRI